MSTFDDIINTDPGELLASLPPLIGFTPSDSIIVIGLDGAMPPKFVGLFRLDHGAENLTELLRDGLLRLGETADLKQALLTLVGGMPEPKSVADEVLTSTLMFQEAAAQIPEIRNGDGVILRGVFSVPEIVKGAPWRRWDSDHSGVLPDPRDTAFASAAVVAGRRTFASRTELADHLRAPDNEATRRRGDLLAAPFDGDRAQLREVITTALTAAHEGSFEPDDRTLVMLRRALDDEDACRDLWHQLDGPRAGAALTITTVLARSFPAPYSSYPKTLVAMCAHARGDGVLSLIATEQAISDSPTAQLPRLLHRAFAEGLGPAQLRSMLGVVR